MSNFNEVVDTIKNFLPYDFEIRIIVLIATLVMVYGVYKLYEINVENKKEEK